MKSTTLSIIVTAHSEGLLAHKTLLSIFRATKNLDVQKISYEIIVNIDRGDDATIEYFTRYKKDPRFIILHTDFGDLGLSRNHARSLAKGKYVAFIDADDMISENWYINAIRHLEKSSHPVVVHPQANIIFGVDVDTTLCIFRNSTNKDIDAIIALGANRWISTSLALKTTYEENPYMSTANGFGHEDYFFNMQTLAKGIMHEVAEDTTHFYRRKANSLMSASNNSHVTQPYTDLFDIKYLQGLPPISPVPHYSPRRMVPPKYVQEAMTAINSIDTEIQLLPEIVDRGLPLFNPDTNNLYVQGAFREIIKNVGSLPDYVFIVPWIVPGGADKVLLNYLTAIKQIHPKWRVAVITTLPSDNPWANRLPDNAYHLDLGNNIAKLNDSERDILMCRLLIQLKCKKLHIINSDFGYRWVMRHMDLVKHNFQLNVSVFSYVKTAFGFEYSYVDPDLREIYPVVHRVFTDNQAVIDQAVACNGFDPAKFKIHHQPIDFDLKLPKQVSPKDLKTRPLKILWASRVDASKRPELLISIAKSLDPKHFQIEAYGKLDPAFSVEIFKNLSCLKYKGKYAGFESLPVDKYDLFLYTSLADGMPNAILEATASGLPIVATNVGGIGDFIVNKESGVTLPPEASAEDYISVLKAILRDSQALATYTTKAQQKLKENHTFANLIDNIKEDF